MEAVSSHLASKLNSHVVLSQDLFSEWAVEEASIVHIHHVKQLSLVYKLAWQNSHQFTPCSFFHSRERTSWRTRVLLKARDHLSLTLLQSLGGPPSPCSRKSSELLRISYLKVA